MTKLITRNPAREIVGLRPQPLPGGYIYTHLMGYDLYPLATLLLYLYFTYIL